MKTAEPNFSARNHLRLRRREHGKILGEAVFMIIALSFSLWIMFHTFSYDGQKHEMKIASKAWSDFGAHIPLIRSFSYGGNFARLIRGQPVESPLFPGEPIRYHFGFYALAGLLERLGIRIDWALNVPSALGFFALIFLLYVTSLTIFANAEASWLTVIFFLFNGSLSSLRFFREHPLSTRTVTDIITNARFPAFGPWDGGDISAFWTLNIYTNQRHLGLSYALLLAIIILLYKPPKLARYTPLLIGGMTALLLFVNFAAAGIAALFFGWTFLIQKKSRVLLLSSAVIILPAFFLLRHMSNISSTVTWQPGYLIRTPNPGIWSFVSFWFANLGLHSILIPAGLILSPKAVRRFLVGPLIALFILPNLYRFSPDMINNHKFFNFFLIVGNMLSAYAVMAVIHKAGRIKHHIGRNVLQITVGILLIVPLTISGIIDFFPLLNDTKGSVQDTRVNADAEFIRTNTKPTDIIANSTWFYHPASVAGRPLLSGYTYFTWSYGYDQGQREALLTSIYRADSINTLCNVIRRTRVTFVELNEQPETYLQPNWALWQSIPPVYENQTTHLTIYSMRDTCRTMPRYY